MDYFFVAPHRAEGPFRTLRECEERCCAVYVPGDPAPVIYRGQGQVDGSRIIGNVRELKTFDLKEYLDRY